MVTREGFLKQHVAFDLASDIANGATQVGSELFQLPAGAFELLGVGEALVAIKARLLTLE